MLVAFSPLGFRCQIRTNTRQGLQHKVLDGLWLAELVPALTRIITLSLNHDRFARRDIHAIALGNLIAAAYCPVVP
jgi:hypothetical protein